MQFSTASCAGSALTELGWIAYGAIATVWEAGSSVSSHQLTQATAGNNRMASNIAPSLPPAAGFGSCSGRSHWLALLFLNKVKWGSFKKTSKKEEIAKRNETFSIS